MTTTFIALLRAINVGKRQVPMKALKALAERLGYTNVRTYVASGNLLFETDGKSAAIEQALDEAITAEFGFPVETVVRTAAEWKRLKAANPFPVESEATPNYVLLLVSRKPVAEGAAEAISARGIAGEAAKLSGGAIWIHFPQGSGVSKVAPAFMDKCCGSPGTSRNVRTVARLAAMASA